MTDRIIGIKGRIKDSEKNAFTRCSNLIQIQGNIHSTIVIFEIFSSPCIKSKDIIDKANFVKTELYIVKSSSQLKG